MRSWTTVLTDSVVASIQMHQAKRLSNEKRGNAEQSSQQRVGYRAIRENLKKKKIAAGSDLAIDSRQMVEDDVVPHEEGILTNPIPR